MNGKYDYIRPHFHQTKNTEMIRKFALLATAAALFVACGGNTEESAEAKAKAAQDSAAKMMEKAEADAKAAQAAMDSTAKAAMDTVKTSMDNAVDAAKEAADKTKEAADAAKKAAH